MFGRRIRGTVSSAGLAMVGALVVLVGWSGAGAAQAVGSGTLYLVEDGGRLETQAAPNLLTALYPRHRLTVEGVADAKTVLDRVRADRGGLGFVSRDAFLRLVAVDPGAAESLELHGAVAEECVFLAVRKDGPVRSYSDLAHDRTQGVVLSRGPEDSRSAEVFRHLVQLDPDLGLLRTDAQSGARALSYVAAGRTEGAIFVAAPDPAHPMLRAIAENPKLTILPLAAPVSPSRPRQGFTAFEAREVAVEGPGLITSGRTVTTLCTPIGIVLNTHGDRGLAEATARAVVDGRVMPRPQGWREQLRGFVDYVKFQVNVLLSFF